MMLAVRRRLITPEDYFSRRSDQDCIFNLCTQITHDIGDAGPGGSFITAEIPSSGLVVAFRSLQGGRASFIGKGRNEFSYSWNCGKCHLQKAFLF